MYWSGFDVNCVFFLSDWFPWGNILATSSTVRKYKDILTTSSTVRKYKDILATSSTVRKYKDILATRTVRKYMDSLNGGPDPAKISMRIRIQALIQKIILQIK